VRRVPDTIRKYPEYVYSIPDSITDRDSEKSISTSSQRIIQEDIYFNNSWSASNMNEVSGTPAKIEDILFLE
jgi:hypothetical protein